MMGSVMNRQADKCSLPCEPKYMTEFVFDHSPARRDSDSTKWQKYADRDVLPMWVADMDFASPPAVQAALDGDASTEAQLQWLQTYGFDHQRAAVGMPSYQCFQDSLRGALTEVLRKSQS